MKVYGLIGFPLGHSFSKQYFDEKFLQEGLTDCVFNNYPINSINELPALIKNTAELAGICITIPYKEQALQFADEYTDDVKKIGACNCFQFNNGNIIAHNTDVAGFKNAFTTLLKPHHTGALILGTGGAAKAVKFVLENLSIQHLFVSRNKAIDPSTIGYQTIDEKLLKDYPVVINCSPVGTYPNESLCPELPYHLVTANNYFFDLVYNPAKTLFLQKAESNGASIQNGYQMLALQAAENWKIWNKV